MEYLDKQDYRHKNIISFFFKAHNFNKNTRTQLLDLHFETNKFMVAYKSIFIHLNMSTKQKRKEK